MWSAAPTAAATVIRVSEGANALSVTILASPSYCYVLGVSGELGHIKCAFEWSGFLAWVWLLVLVFAVNWVFSAAVTYFFALLCVSAAFSC